MIAYKTTMVADAQALLPQQSRNAATQNSLVKIFANRAQEIETVLFNMIAQRQLGTASAAQLDDIGNLLGEPRNNRDDEPYRRGIRARILVNRGSAEMPTIIRVLQLLLPTFTFYVQPLYPAAYLAQVLQSGFSDPQSVWATMQEATAAGVRGFLQFEANGHTDADTFTLDGATNQDLDAGYLCGLL